MNLFFGLVAILFTFIANAAPLPEESNNQCPSVWSAPSKISTPFLFEVSKSQQKSFWIIGVECQRLGLAKTQVVPPSLLEIVCRASLVVHDDNPSTFVLMRRAKELVQLTKTPPQIPQPQRAPFSTLKPPDRALVQSLQRRFQELGLIVKQGLDELMQPMLESDVGSVAKLLLMNPLEEALAYAPFAAQRDHAVQILVEAFKPQENTKELGFECSLDDLLVDRALTLGSSPKFKQYPAANPWEHRQLLLAAAQEKGIDIQSLCNEASPPERHAYIQSVPFLLDIARNYPSEEEVRSDVDWHWQENAFADSMVLHDFMNFIDRLTPELVLRFIRPAIDQWVNTLSSLHASQRRLVVIIEKTNLVGDNGLVEVLKRHNYQVEEIIRTQ